MVAEVRFNRPELLNSVSREMRDELLSVPSDAEGGRLNEDLCLSLGITNWPVQASFIKRAAVFRGE